MDQILIQFFRLITRLFHFFHKDNAGINLDLCEYVQIMFITGSCRTAYDQFKCIKMIINIFHHPGMTFIRHLRKCLHLVLHRLICKVSLDRPVSLFQHSGRFFHQYIKQRFLVCIIAVQCSCGHRQSGCDPTHGSSLKSFFQKFLLSCFQKICCQFLIYRSHMIVSFIQ